LWESLKRCDAVEGSGSLADLWENRGGSNCNVDDLLEPLGRQEVTSNVARGRDGFSESDGVEGAELDGVVDCAIFKERLAILVKDV